ncbi:hypothetical protein HanPI659440_Chr03g0104511 [Helianthus annuus]|nr:hypothetical protein HanPI659440_Chr03g0104511 [Helianthus annuus]
MVETMLVDESNKEDEAEVEVNVEEDVRLSPDSSKLLKAISKELAAGDEEGVDENKSSSSSSDEEIDETERAKIIQAEIENEKQLKRKRREYKDDELYNPSPENVIESQTPPSSGGRKKQSARKRVVTPRAAKSLKVLLKKKPVQKPSKPPTPPPEPSPPQSPHKSPPKQPTPPPSPPPQTEQHLSPLHLSPPHQSPQHEQPVVTSQQIFQTPPSTQPPIQSTPGSSSLKDFPHIPGNIPLDDIGDFNFASDKQVKSLEKKFEEVLFENKKLLDPEKKLEKHVKTKARRDEQNKYFELKNKELEAAKAMKEHEIYMMNKVFENLLGKSVEQKQLKRLELDVKLRLMLR